MSATHIAIFSPLHQFNLTCWVAWCRCFQFPFQVTVTMSIFPSSQSDNYNLKRSQLDLGLKNTLTRVMYEFHTVIRSVIPSRIGVVRCYHVAVWKISWQQSMGVIRIYWYLERLPSCYSYTNKEHFTSIIRRNSYPNICPALSSEQSSI